MTTDLAITAQSAVSIQAFQYSDGNETEKRLLECLRACRDVSALSTELRSYITDWPSEYHFSSLRHNLLRPFSFAPGMRILELGCGCGAITRYLGETGASITAIEGSSRRASIARERCRDLKNVEIYCANLMDYSPQEHFDYVLLIGVLEYAPQYVSAQDPILACLEHAGAFLAESGALILAIENQLGLKYLNGCNEDHIGIPYYGVHGLYGEKEPQTYGKHELIKHLTAAGFTQQDVFYPFPDYKLPNIIIAEAALSLPEFDIGNLLCRTATANRDSAFSPTFLENMAWPAIAANGLLGDLANSFLIFARKTHANQSQALLACIYATERLPRFATETRFTHQENLIHVDKRPLLKSKQALSQQMPQGELRHVANIASKYIPGEIYLIELQRTLGRGGGLDELVVWADRWIDYLVSQCRQTNGITVIDGKLLDATPSNLIRGNDGSLNLIDQEWLITTPIPLGWVLVRGLLNSITASPHSAKLAKMTYRQIIEHVASRAERNINVRLGDFFAEANLYENALRSIVFDKQAQLDLIASSLDMPAGSLLNGETLHDIAHRQKLELIENKMEVARIKSTISWQITKPLRLFANLPRLLRKLLFTPKNK